MAAAPMMIPQARTTVDISVVGNGCLTWTVRHQTGILAQKDDAPHPIDGKVLLLPNPVSV